jgi:hypothetical protein
MPQIRRVLAAEYGFLLDEVTSYRGRRVVAASYVVSSGNRRNIARFENQAAAERHFCDEIRRARASRNGGPG